MKITALAGGVGGAKLLIGLQQIAGPGLTAIVNTGDDAEMYGLRVSPDVDICTYWLAGIADTGRGWGIKDDTFDVVDAVGALGSETWFRLGDRDLATCLYRTQRLSAGATLSQVTREIARALGVESRIIPATDDRMRTFVVTGDGRTLSFQEYFVRERCDVDVAEIILDGAADARPAPGVLDAIAQADLAVLCPSNPVLSLGPILALPGVIETLQAHPRVVGVTPIINGATLKGPADRLLKGLGIGSSASAVAGLYRRFLDEFVVDASDAAEGPRVESLGITARLIDTVITDADVSRRLAEELVFR